MINKEKIEKLILELEELCEQYNSKWMRIPIASTSISSGGKATGIGICIEKLEKFIKL